MNITKLKKFIMTALICLMFGTNIGYTSDLLQKGFEPSLDGGTIINVGNDKNAVGSFFFGGGVEIGLDGVEIQIPFIVRLTTFLLRLTLILGITMVIRNGIRFIGAMGQEATRQAIGKTVGFIALGVILALASVVVVNILQSVTRSSITDSPEALNATVSEDDEGDTGDEDTGGGFDPQDQQAAFDACNGVLENTAILPCVAFCGSNPGEQYENPAGGGEFVQCPQ